MLKIDFWNIAFTVINLMVLYFFLKHFLIGPVTAILEQRQNAIEENLDAAQDTKNQALMLKSQYEASMGNAREEAAQIVADAKVRAGQEYDKIMAQAKADAEKRMEDADRTIAMERDKTMHDLESAIAGLAMTAAAKLLEEQAGSTGDQQIYNRFLKEAGESHDG